MYFIFIHVYPHISIQRWLFDGCATFQCICAISPMTPLLLHQNVNDIIVIIIKSNHKPWLSSALFEGNWTSRKSPRARYNQREVDEGVLKTVLECNAWLHGLRFGLSGSWSAMRFAPFGPETSGIPCPFVSAAQDQHKTSTHDSWTRTQGGRQAGWRGSLRHTH